MDHTELSPVDLAIACLQGGDQAAWAEFIRRFNPLIAGIVMRVARQWGEYSPEIFDDLIQETYLKLCSDRTSLLNKFDPHHPNSIYGYIKVFTANAVHDHFKSLRTQKRGVGVTTGLTVELQAEVESRSPSSSAKSMELSILFGEIDSILRESEIGANGERDRRIFWLYYRAGLTSAAISSTAGIGLNTKGVESTILRLTRRVRMRMTASKVAKRLESHDFPGEGIRASDSF